jgi:phospholipid transport system transporter-binding protein
MKNFDVQTNALDQLEIIGELSFNTIPKLRNIGCHFITKNERPIFNLQQVISEDNSGVALLMAWTRFAKKLGKNVYFINLPNQLRDVIKLSGLEDILPIK